MSDQKKPTHKKNANEIPAFLCIITPVFDPAYESVCKLVNELNSQTYRDFFQVLISNGSSPRIKELVFDINRKDSRFIYDEIAEEITNNPVEILINIGKRREYCIKKYNAERYMFLDADVKLVDNDYFLKLYRAHQEIDRDILMTLTKYYHQEGETVLPIFPIIHGHIDIANYTFSKRIAKAYNYPTDYDPDIGIGNDYRFFTMISNENNTALLNFVPTIKDGNNSYKRFTELILEEQQRIEVEQRKAEEEQEIIQREQQKLLMNNSITAPPLKWYQRVIDKMLLSGTRRRYYYDLARIGIEIIIGEGWKNFFIKLWYRLRLRGETH